MEMKERTIKVYCQANGKSNYPEIRLAGKWLYDNGFEVGDYIRIAYKSDVILIKRIKAVNVTER